jgi:hypothetical protein
MYNYKYVNITIQIIIGYLLADLIVGLFHWFEDNYLDYCNEIPIFSELAKDNEMHHYFPRSMLAYSYLEHIQYTLPACLLLLLLLYIFNKSIFKYYFFIISFSFFCVTSNIIHRFSHMRFCENNYIIILLQSSGILCSHTEHSKHHNSPHEKYCVVSDYNNYILDSIYFWRTLEYIIYLVTNIEPKNKIGYYEYHNIQNHIHSNAKLECPEKPTKNDVEELKELLQKFKKCGK